jgi:hypothetical protein
MAKFEIRNAKQNNCYVVDFHDNNDHKKFYVHNFRKTKGYPKTAKHEYDAQSISLVEDNKFTRLSKSSSSSRELHYLLVEKVTQHIQHEEALKHIHQQEEEQRFSLLEQSIDDLSDEYPF